MSRGVTLSYSNFDWLNDKTPGCPFCSGKLKRDRVNKTMHTATNLGADYDVTSEHGVVHEVYFEYDVFYCKNCDRNIRVELLKDCFKAIEKMEKQQMLELEGQTVCYLYEVSPMDVHKENHDCGECGKRLRMKSAEADISCLNEYKYQWMPFYKDGAVPEESVLRRVYYLCPRCGKEYSTKAVLSQKVRGIKKLLWI